jgi:catechol 2,3-dioxygenase-like lactoylglutathione lyase family enzyme
VSVQLNHTIVSCRDQQRSAAFLSEILGLPPATRFGHFLVVEADNAVSLDFAESSGEIVAQHYAFLVGEDEFDAAFGRIRDRGLTYWADPGKSRPGRSTTTTAAAACTSTTPTVTGWRSSPARTAAAARSLTGESWQFSDRRRSGIA